MKSLNLSLNTDIAASDFVRIDSSLSFDQKVLLVLGSGTFTQQSSFINQFASVYDSIPPNTFSAFLSFIRTVPIDFFHISTTTLTTVFSSPTLFSSAQLSDLCLAFFLRYHSNPSDSPLLDPLCTIIRSPTSPSIPPSIVSHCINGTSSTHTPSLNIECLKLVSALLSNPSCPERSRLLSNTLLCSTSPSAVVRALVAQSLPSLSQLISKNPSTLKSSRARQLNNELSNKIVSVAITLLSDSVPLVKNTTFKSSILVLQMLNHTPLSSTLASKFIESLSISNSREFSDPHDDVILSGSIVVISSFYGEVFSKLVNSIQTQFKASMPNQSNVGSNQFSNIFKSFKYLAVSIGDASVLIDSYLEFFTAIFEYFGGDTTVSKFGMKYSVVQSKYNVDCSVLASHVMSTFKSIISDGSTTGKITSLSSIFELFLILACATSINSAHHLPKILSKILNFVSMGLEDSQSTVVKISLKILFCIVHVIKKPKHITLAFNRQLSQLLSTDPTLSRDLGSLSLLVLKSHQNLDYSSWRLRKIYVEYFKNCINLIQPSESFEYLKGIFQIISDPTTRDLTGNQIRLPSVLIDYYYMSLSQMVHLIKGKSAVEYAQSIIFDLSQSNSTFLIDLFCRCCGHLSSFLSACCFCSKYLDAYLSIFSKISAKNSDNQLNTSFLDTFLSSVFNVKANLVSFLTYLRQNQLNQRLVENQSKLYELDSIFELFREQNQSKVVDYVDEFYLIDEEDCALVWDSIEEQRRLSREQSNLIEVDIDYAAQNSGLKGLPASRAQFIEKKLNSFRV
ncbi:hypothetical protein RCL1_002758 [Eukaryota sp. TZLM3-RCL]